MWARLRDHQVRTTLFFAVIAVLAVFAASPARAVTSSWSSPSDLSDNTQAADVPQVAVDGVGNAVAVWVWYDGSNFRVQAATQPVNGSWSTPVTLSAALQDGSNPQIAVDRAGNAVAIWTWFDGTNSRVQSASLPVNGNWGSVTTLSASGQDARNPQVAVDAAGDAVAVWSRFDGANYRIQSASLPAGGTWNPSVATLSDVGQDAEHPQVAVDAAGDAVAVWVRYDGANYLTQAATRSAGGTWNPSVATLSDVGQDAENAHVAVDSAGDAVVVWDRFDISTSVNVIQSAVLPRGGSWSSAANVSPPGSNSTGPDVAVDSAGNAVVVWRGYDGTFNIVQAASRPAGGSWGTAVPVSAAGRNAATPHVRVDTAGDAVAIWRRSNVSNNAIQAAVLPFGGSWGTPVELSPNGQEASEPAIAVSSVGNAVGVWLVAGGGGGLVQAARLSVTYTVMFDPNGASGSTPAPVGYGAGAGSMTLPTSAGLTRPGFAFVGWNTAADGSGASYAAGAAFTATGDVTLYAQWRTLAATGFDPFEPALLASLAVILGAGLLALRAKRDHSRES